MIVQSWNIQAGGGTRMKAIMTSIAKNAADTVVLGETTSTRLAELKTSLAKLGFSTIHAPVPPDRKRGMLIASKRPFEIREPSASGEVEAHRWLEAWCSRADNWQLSVRRET